MRTTVENACSKKRIGTAVPRLSTWEPQKRICFMSGRNMGSKSGSLEFFLCIVSRLDVVYSFLLLQGQIFGEKAASFAGWSITKWTGDNKNVRVIVSQSGLATTTTTTMYE
jgi:hypothetical protein